MPILHRNSFKTRRCLLVCYGVLIRISPGYPPVQGKFHTCYAPVRRSPAMYCYTPLPLDLHVLSLPLAFILSQDQTLRCKRSFDLDSMWSFFLTCVKKTFCCSQNGQYFKERL